MAIPGSGRLLRHASRQLGGRMVRELGLPKAVGAALGVSDEEEDRGEGDTVRRRKREVHRRPLQVIDKASERAIGERAFQASLAYLDGELPSHMGTALAQAIAHAVVEALDEYLLRTQGHDLPGGV